MAVTGGNDTDAGDEGGGAAAGAAVGAADFIATDVPLEPVLERLEDFFSSPELTSAISDFMTEHSAGVEFRAPDDEQPMGNYEVFRQYSQVGENLLEDFLRHGLALLHFSGQREHFLWDESGG